MRRAIRKLAEVHGLAIRIRDNGAEVLPVNDLDGRQQPRG
jgi:hypothetical protein